MSRQLTPAQERTAQRAMDMGERLICLIFYAGLVLRLSPSLALRPYNLLGLISETLIVVFIVFRRGAQTVTTRPLDWAAAVLGSNLTLLINGDGRPLAPVAIGASLMLMGLLVAIWAKLALRRSFGVAAANRGVVAGGPYRIVRHPMYTGYLLGFIGFWLNNPSLRNGLLYLGAILFMLIRIFAEERVLKQDPAYAEVVDSVPYRIIPGLF
jgi:protein-S-isoprenylcysteine O-methyltransferase Ste14